MFESALALYQIKKITPARMVALSFLELGQCLVGKGFIQAPELRRSLEEWNQLSDEKMGELFVHARFKGVKAKVSQALGKWLGGVWSLTLLHHIPNVYEVLALQAQGTRCVTLFLDRENWGAPKLTKDNALHFLVHDLEHAVQYFSFFHGEQLALNQKFLALYHDDYFKQLIESPFKERLDYLLSDMNTHPEHSYQFLQAIWFDYATAEKLAEVETYVHERMTLLQTPS